MLGEIAPGRRIHAVSGRVESLDRLVVMAQAALKNGAYDLEGDRYPALSVETRRHLGTTLRAIYEGTLDTQPLPDAQVDLLLRLRHKERDLRRGV